MSGDAIPSTASFADLVELAKVPGRHSPIGFSSAERWFNCPGSRRLIESLPPEQRNRGSVYAFRGTVAHLVAWFRLHFGFWPLGTPDEFVRLVQVYVDLIKFLGAAGCEVYLEHRFELPEVHPLAFGTSDGVIVNRAAGWAAVVDLKTGEGKGVEVSFWDEVKGRLRGNLQLMGYGAGTLLRIAPAVEWYHLYVAQPPYDHPDGPVRMHPVHVSEMMDFVHELRLRAHATDQADAALNPGAWCQFCPAAGICTAAQDSERRELATAFEPVPGYDPAQLGRALEWIRRVKPWMAAVARLAHREALEGRIPPGHKLVRGRNSKRWCAGAEMFLAEAGVPASAMYTEPELRSPHQVETALSGPIKKRVAEFYTKQSSGVRLVPESDRGEPIGELLPGMFDNAEENEQSEEIS